MKRLTRDYKQINISFDLNLKVVSGILIAFSCFYILKFYNLNESHVVEISHAENLKNVRCTKTLRYWGVSVSKWNPNGSLRTMNRVFRKLGYKFVNASNGDQWDILWSIEYPFKSTIRQKTRLLDPMDLKLRIDQRVNHFPGIQYITNKGSLGNHTKSKYFLPMFVFPHGEEKFIQFSSDHPDAKYVEKNYDNRGVRIVTVDEFKRNNNKKVYQVFQDKPFLIDGHAFDFGVYVLTSSVSPLRIYRYDHEVFIRFCPEKYHPFDPKITQKYVVDGNHMSVFEMPSFKQLFDGYGYSAKMIFENIIKRRGFDVKNFWLRIDDAVSDIISKNEHHIIGKIKSDGYEKSHNFFEMVRFDIILDENLHPYVMEVNMSPNITPSKKEHEKYSLIYEQLVYNTLNLIGAGSYDSFMSRFSNDTISANIKNIATNLDECNKSNCFENCKHPSCDICIPCLSSEVKFHMIESYRELIRRGNFKRVFPGVNHYHNDKLYEKLSEKNKIFMRWFEEKCESDESWC